MRRPTEDKCWDGGEHIPVPSGQTGEYERQRCTRCGTVLYLMDGRIRMYSVPTMWNEPGAIGIRDGAK